MEARDTLRIFSASSLTDVLTILIKRFEAKYSIHCQAVFASSSTLAKQIEHGAPADLYLSAHVFWMNRLDRSGYIASGTRFNLLKNSLVLVTHRDNQFLFSQENITGVRDLIKTNRLVMGNPAHVPAGMYGKKAFQYFRIWKDVYRRAVFSPNSRTSIAFLNRRETTLGVVYYSDVISRKSLKILAKFPTTSHPAILYPIAIIKDRKRPATDRLVTFLKSNSSQLLFETHGFSRSQDIFGASN